MQRIVRHGRRYHVPLSGETQAPGNIAGVVLPRGDGARERRPLGSGGSVTVRLNLRVSPRAASTAWAGWAGERIKLRVAAAPEGGRANAALVEFLAERLGLPRAQIEVVAGHGSRDKTVEIHGADPAAVLSALPPRQGA